MSERAGGRAEETSSATRATSDNDNGARLTIQKRGKKARECSNDARTTRHDRSITVSTLLKREERE